MKWIPILAAIFVVLPIVELSLLLMIAQVAGHWWVSVLLVILTGTLGAFLARWQGRSVWSSFLQTARQGKLPADEFVDGAIIFFAAGLLLTPGVITDVAGLLMLSPLGRPLVRRRVKAWIQKRFDIKVDIGGFSSATSFTPSGSNVLDAEGRTVEK